MTTTLTNYTIAQNETHGPWSDARDLIAAAHEQRARESGECDEPTEEEIAFAATLTKVVVKTVTTSPLYLVEIRGSNGSGNVVLIERDGKTVAEVCASTSGRTSTALKVDNAGDHTYAGYRNDLNVALFASKHLASEVALSALWNGQRFRIKAARGTVKRTGVLVDVAPDDLLHSRSSEQTTTVARPAHHPSPESAK